MKPFLGIDVTKNKKNESLNGEEFIVARTSTVLSRSFEESTEDAAKMLKKAVLPLYALIVQRVCGVAFVICLASFLQILISGEGLPFAKMYSNAPWFFWLIIVCGIAAVLLTILSTRRVKHVLGSEESKRVLNDLSSIVDNIFTELNVRSDAPDVDLITVRYKEKNRKPVPKERFPGNSPYNNPIFKLYTEGEALILANVEAKYAIPLSELRAIRTVKKRILLPNWNKEAKPTEEPYKVYKLRTYSSESLFHCKPYHILELEHNGELWGIYFPCYELPAFEACAGLKAE